MIQSILLTYGVANENGDIITEQAALEVFDKLQQQAEAKTPNEQGYYLGHVSIEGDRTQGKIIGTFYQVDGREVK